MRNEIFRTPGLHKYIMSEIAPDTAQSPSVASGSDDGEQNRPQAD